MLSMMIAVGVDNRNHRLSLRFLFPVIGLAPVSVT